MVARQHKNLDFPELGADVKNSLHQISFVGPTSYFTKPKQL